MKIIAEGSSDVTGGVVTQIAHGLTYTPFVMGFAEGSSARLYLPRWLGGASGGTAGNLQGYIYADDTYIYISVNTNANVYYYVFIDPLQE